MIILEAFLGSDIKMLVCWNGIHCLVCFFRSVLPRSVYLCGRTQRNLELRKNGSRAYVAIFPNMFERQVFFNFWKVYTVLLVQVGDWTCRIEWLSVKHGNDAEVLTFLQVLRKPQLIACVILQAHYLATSEIFT